MSRALCLLLALWASVVLGCPPALGVGGGAVWPLQPRPPVVRGFEPPSSLWGPGHRGVDLLGHVGEPVLASAAGRISFTGVIAGVAVVVVDHGDLRTTYQPVRALVQVGDQVGAGQPVGVLQLGGSHCFPRACLHWGLVRGSTYLDPLTLLGLGPVRLLPLDGARRLDPVSHTGAWPRASPVPVRSGVPRAASPPTPFEAVLRWLA